jgi:hypothetical protein
MAKGSLLYLTQAETMGTAPGELIRTDKVTLLRAYLILHAMFFDRLTVGDSQLINIPDLRSLIWSDEPLRNPEVLSDLAPLLDRGVLVPAIRSSASSLTQVREDLVDRGVYYAGSADYAHFIEQHIEHTDRIIYEAGIVSALFREQVLAILSGENTRLRLKDSVRRAAYDYVANQDVLYHIRMRQWMAAEMEYGRMNDFHSRKLERVLEAAYRNNVPMSIEDSLVDVPIDPRRFWTPIDIRLGNQSIIKGADPADFATFPMRPFSVSPRVLGALPTEALFAIRDDPARRRAVKRLDDFRQTGRVDGPRLAEDIERFLYAAEEIAYSEVRGELRERIKERRRASRRAQLIVTRDLGLAIAGISIWGAISNVAAQVGSAAGYTGLVVTACASIQALRDLGSAYRHGYAVGREVPSEHRLVLSRP